MTRVGVLSCLLLLTTTVIIGASVTTAAPHPSSSIVVVSKHSFFSGLVNSIKNLITNTASTAEKAYTKVQDEVSPPKQPNDQASNNQRKLLEMRNEGSLNERSKTALNDCLEVINATLGQLHQTNQDLDGYNPYSNKKELRLRADKLKIYTSATMTNQQTCLDGFSHSEADKKVRESILGDIVNVGNMCRQTLGLIKNMTDNDLRTSKNGNSRKLLSSSSDWFPEWLSTGDKKLLLLQSRTMLKPNVVVAKDGSGNYKTVSEAVANAPGNSGTRYVIKIKAGVYRENVVVDKTKTNIMFVGDGRTNTIITGNRNVRDGSTTFRSATVGISGEGFLARDITFENTAGPEKHQAVALRVNADLSAFYHCDILGYRDTLYVHSMRQFYVNCLIAGTVDIIFGNAAAVFQDCDIHVRNPGMGRQNTITAQGRTDPNENTGIVIQKSRIGATSEFKPFQNQFSTFLGRPWKAHSRTVVMQSAISDVVDPRGWLEWNGTFALDTLVYREYKNTGPGADTSRRVNWKGYKVITSGIEARSYSVANFIDGSSWLPHTTFPFTLGL